MAEKEAVATDATSLTSSRRQTLVQKSKPINLTVKKHHNETALKLRDAIKLDKNSNCSSEGLVNPYCLEYNFKRLISPKWKCQDKTLLLMMVTSAPQHSDRRKLLRRTWCSDFKSVHGSVRHIFLFGKPTSGEQQRALEMEAAIHGDILQDDFVENYWNLTIKTIMAFRWFHKYCNNVSFFMKCDDDIFINTPTLIPFLNQGKQLYKNTLLGKCFKKAVIHRDPKHKWYVNYMQLSQRYFSPYCSGAGYIVDSPLAHKVAALMPSIPTLPTEDAYVGHCVKYLKGNVADTHGFILTKHTLDELLKMVRSKLMLTVHKADNAVVLSLWQTALNTSKSLKTDFVDS